MTLSVSDVTELDDITRGADSLSDPERRTYHPHDVDRVELGASRDARPDRRRLIGVILVLGLSLAFRRWAARRVIPMFYPMDEDAL